jgi:anti-sigma regulatory factor (Ser/Thr protein kinase)
VRGFERLRAALARPEIARSSSPAAALYRALLKRGGNDDVVVLTLQLEPEADVDDANGDGAKRWTFDSKDARRAHAARHSFVQALRDAGLRRKQLDAAELVFGELLGNVVRFAPGPVEIILNWTHAAAPVLHVLDRGPGFTFAPKLPLDLLSERGRGLYIVWSLAEDCNVTLRHDGGAHARAVLATV